MVLIKKVQVLKQLIFNGDISVKKTVNLIRNYYAMKTKNPNVAGYPSLLMIEPTNFCNLRCPLCPTGSGALTVPRGYMKLDNFKKIIDECGDYLFNVTLWNWGEPFLNRDIIQIIEYAKAKKIYIRVSTNGHHVRDEETAERVVRSGCDEIMFAIDGASQETYIKYRVGGNYEDVMRNLQLLVNAKKKLKSKIPHIELQFIVMSHNQHEIPIIKDIAKKVGVDRLRLKTVSLEGANALGFEGDKEKIKSFKPDDKYSRYNENMVRKEIKNTCEWLWLGAVINWDGTISPCCNDPNREVQFGNVFDAGFKEVWKNHLYVEFRKRLLREKQNIDMCKNCSGALIDFTDLEVSVDQ